MENIDNFLKEMDTLFGKGAVITATHFPDVPKMSSGVLSVDIASGGGYPIGRVIEVYGPESSGKTTLAIHAMAQAQKDFPDKVVAIVDMEHAFDSHYAAKLGVDVGRLLISQPDYGEQALDIAEKMIKSGHVSFLLVDSVAALTPKSELEGEMEDSSMGVQARMMSKAMRKLTSATSNHKCVVMFINQLRDKIGVMFGNPATTTGGNALKFFASQRIELTKSQGAKNAAGEMSSNKIKAKFVKNKVAPPQKTAEYEIEFGDGICNELSIINYGVELGIIKKAGAWYSLAEDGSKLGQGAEGVKQMLRDNPELTDALKEIILSAYFPDDEAEEAA